MTTTKDGAISSLSNSGDYVVSWNIDNEDYVGSGVMNITITPVQVVVLYGDNSSFVYNGQIQSINYTISEQFEYSIKYNDPEIPRGVILLTFPESCQLSTKQYYLNEIREALGLKRNGTLSTSSMEALAIVAYNQPVTRFFVDSLRRADSSYAMNNLIDRGLIESKGRLDAPGRPMLYGTTPDFLRAFGINSIDELPKTTEEMQMMFAVTTNTEQKEEEIAEGDGVIQTTIDDIEAENAKEASEAEAEFDFEPSADDYMGEDALESDTEATEEI